MGRPSGPTSTPATVNPPSSAGAALSGWPSIATAISSMVRWVSGPPVRASAATIPATVAAADDPRPRASGTRLVIRIRQPSAAGSPSDATARAASSARTTRFDRSAPISPAALALHGQLDPGVRSRDRLELDGVHEVEREADAVVPGSEVRGGRRDLDDDAPAVELGEAAEEAHGRHPCRGCRPASGRIAGSLTTRGRP